MGRVEDRKKKERKAVSSLWQVLIFVSRFFLFFLSVVRSFVLASSSLSFCRVNESRFSLLLALAPAAAPLPYYSHHPPASEPQPFEHPDWPVK